MARPRFDSEDDEDEGYSAPVRRRKRRRSRGWRGPSFDWFWQSDGIIKTIVLLTALGVLLAGLAFVVPKAALGTLGIAILFIISSWILFYAAAFSEGIEYALACFFIPFFGLYYLISRFEETKWSFFVSMLGIFLLFASFAAEVIRAPGLPGPADEAPGRTDRSAGRTPQETPPTLPVSVDPALQTNEPLVFLTEMKMYAVKDGPWPVTAGNTGAPDRAAIRINNKVSPNGIGMHPPDAPGRAGASFALGGAAKRFKGWVGLNQFRSDAWSPVGFAVRGDGRVIWDFNNMTRKLQPVEFDIDVSRVKVLTIETYTDIHLHAHAVWFEPHLEK